jgi:hypothetical protein
MYRCIYESRGGFFEGVCATSHRPHICADSPPPIRESSLPSVNRSKGERGCPVLQDDHLVSVTTTLVGTSKTRTSGALTSSTGLGERGAFGRGCTPGSGLGIHDGEQEV